MEEIIIGLTDLPETLHMQFPREIGRQLPSVFNLISQNYDSQIIKFFSDHSIKRFTLLHCSCSSARASGINARQDCFFLLHFSIDARTSRK